MAEIVTGILLGLLGVCILLLVYVIVRRPRHLKIPPGLAVFSQLQDTQSNTTAVLIVEPGGKILYSNQVAKKWFGYLDVLPDLERLTRRTEPEGAFLGLCFAEGQARFTLDGRLVEGFSHHVPFFVNNSHSESTALKTAMLVSLSFPKLMIHQTGVSQVNSSTLDIVTKLSVDMASHLELEPTLTIILDRVEQLIPSDFQVISLWDPVLKNAIPYRLVGSPGKNPSLEKITDPYPADKGFTGLLIQKRQPLFIPDVSNFHQVKPAQVHNSYQSYMGVPLLVEEKVLGVLELANRVRNSYQEYDFDLLRLLSGPASVSLNNSIRYQTELTNEAEASGLARLSQGFEYFGDIKELFTHLVNNIVGLLEVKFLGFLIYQDAHHLLKAQAPFHGIPEQLLNLYQVVIPSGTPAEELFYKQETIIAQDAAQDLSVRLLGLDTMAVASGMHTTVLLPLKTKDRNLGYLQVSDLQNGQPFPLDKIQLLEKMAAQSTLLIETALLVKENQVRAQRAETLRRVAALAASSATLDEILSHSLRELARLLRAEFGFFYLLDEYLGELSLHKPSILLQSEFIKALPDRFSVTDSWFPVSVTSNMKPLLITDLENTSFIPIFYKESLTNIKARSAVIAPLIVRSQGVGEVYLGGSEANQFDPNDLALLSTAASQISNAIEKFSLYGQTDERLRRRVVQLLALNRISRELNTTLELDRLLQVVFEQGLQTTDAECGVILLFELSVETQSWPKITFHVGDSGSHSLTSVEMKVLRMDAPLIVKDYLSPDPTAPDTMPIPPHSGVRSSLIVPIAYRKYIAGIIHLHSHIPNHFDETSREIAQSLAVQAAIAIGNAQRFKEQQTINEMLNRKAATLTTLFESTRDAHIGQPLGKSMEAIAHGVQAATPFDVVLIDIYDPDTGYLVPTAFAGISQETFNTSKTAMTHWTSLQDKLPSQHSRGQSCFFPGNQLEKHHTQSQSTINSNEVWLSDDSFMVPLISVDDLPLGVMRVDSPRNGLRPDRPTIESVEIFASQATQMIEISKKMERLVAQSQEFETELEQSRVFLQEMQYEVNQQRQHNLKAAHEMTKMTNHLRRLRSSLEIADQVDQQQDRNEILLTLAEQIHTSIEVGAVLVAELVEGSPKLLHAVGDVPVNVTLQTLLGQRNPLRTCMQTGKPVFVPDLGKQEGWKNSPLLNVLGAQSFLCFPIFYELSKNDTSEKQPQIEAAVLATLPSVLDEFGPQDEEIFMLVSRQVTISLQNLRMISETNNRLQEMNLLLEFTRQLSSFNPTTILNTLVEGVRRVIPAAQAAIAAMWNSEAQILIPLVAQGYIENEKILHINFRKDESLPGQAYAQGKVINSKEMNYTRDYSFKPDQVMLYRDATQGRFPISSLIVPLQTFESTLGVLVLENFHETDAFNPNDEALVVALARQTALTLENVHLYQSVEKRASQLQVLTQVAGTITSSLHPDDLVRTLLDQARNVVPFDSGILWLREANQMVIRASADLEKNTSGAGLTAVALEDSELLHEIVTTNQPLSVQDIRLDRRFPSKTDLLYLSWLGVPLLTKGDVIGVIVLEKSEPGFYTQEDVQAMVTFSGQAAVAFQNARLFQETERLMAETQQRSVELAALFDLGVKFTQVLDLNRLLEITFENVTLLIQPDTILVAVTGPENTLITHALDHNERREPATVLQQGAGLLDFVLTSTQPILVADTHFPDDSISAAVTHETSRCWLGVPLIIRGKVNGVLSVQSNQPNAFGEAQLHLLSQIGNQLSVALDNANLFTTVQKYTSELEQRVSERTEQVDREHRRIQTLLEITTELTASLDLDLVLNRTLSLMNETIESEQSSILLIEPDSMNLYLRASLGYTGDVPQSGQISKIRRNEGLAGWAIENRQSVLIDDLHADQRWQLREDRTNLHRSAMVVPLIVGEEILGIMMIYHRRPHFFNLDQLDLVQAIAKQAAIAINNTQLYKLIRDQAEKLGDMLRTQHIETSRSQAILEAVADGVLVTDVHRKITLFNASAESILNLSRQDVLGKSLDHFTGLFGKAAQSWLQTIHAWSKDPESYHEADIYEAQIDLDNRRVASVHLSPVRLKNDFLGTVSIIRDITHEVAVDRLKSEFVGTVSHELRTPMTSIKGFVDILLMGAAGQLNPQQTHFMEIVRSNTERLTVLVNDLLDVSRIEAGKVILSIQPIDLHPVVDEIIGSYHQRMKEEKRVITIQADIPANLPLVRGDPERIRQIFDNIIENSYQYTPDGGQVWVTLRVAKNANSGLDEVQANIRDNGIGIRPEEKDRIFERFYRGEDPLVLASSGTGLGLSIVQTLVQMHNGKIWFESEGISGLGSTFIFTLPVFKPDQTPISHLMALEPVLEPQPSKGIGTDKQENVS